MLGIVRNCSELLRTALCCSLLLSAALCEAGSGWLSKLSRGPPDTANAPARDAYAPLGSYTFCLCSATDTCVGRTSANPTQP